MSSPENSATHKPLFKFDWLRCTLCLFFLVYAYIIAQGLMPLPDEPPRIKFKELFCVVCGLVIAYYALVSRYRIFIPLVLLFLIWPARIQLNERIEFLQMMLEPHRPENILRWALIGVGLLIILPKSWRLFKASLKEAKIVRPRIFQQGFRF